MPIMQSCCCWRSVRRGSFACAIYTGCYFGMLVVTTLGVAHKESEYLKGNRTQPQSSSILEFGTISPTTLRFNVMLLVCSSSGVICCLLLLYGLFKDQRIFLIPWMIALIACSVVDIAHIMYLFITASRFEPVSAMMYTCNFFVHSLNIYALLCVISQYQEYGAGRGTAADDYEYRVPAVRYATQPPTTTATSCLSSRRTATNNETKATATPTQSPTSGQNTLSVEKSPLGARPPRKHVQFPDTAQRKGEFESPTIVLVSSESCPKNDLPKSSSPGEIQDPESTESTGETIPLGISILIQNESEYAEFES